MLIELYYMNHVRLLIEHQLYFVLDMYSLLMFNKN